MINLLPKSQTPSPRTPKMIGDDRAKYNQQLPLTSKVFSFYLGMASLMLAMFLISLI